MNARDYFAVLRENKLIIALCLVIGLGLGWGATQILPRTYTSSVTFLVQAGSTSVGQQNPNADLYSGIQLAKDRVKSYATLVTGARVSQDAANRLGGSGITAEEIQGRVTVTAAEDTVLMTLTATGRTADDAVTLIKAVAAAFQEVVTQVETQKTNGVPETQLINGVATPIPPVASVSQLDAPVAPADPITPKLSLNVGIGALLGLVVGFGIAIGRRSLDTSVRTPEELERITEAGVLGSVPEDKAKGTGSAIPGGSGAGATAEAYRRIRTNLEFANVDGNRRVLVITSAVPEEGKTTTACNLAMTLAAIGARVLLVDGDLRRPAAAAMLGLEGSVGMTTVLMGKVELRRAIQSGNIGGIDVLASGRTPPRPNELLSSRRAAAMISELRTMYDFVLIDAPPILPVADAMNLGIHADGAIVVCRWGKTSRQSVIAAAAALRGVSVPVVGTVLTRVSRKAKSATAYYGTYGNGPSDPDMMVDIPGDYRPMDPRPVEPLQPQRPAVEQRAVEQRMEQQRPVEPRPVEPRPGDPRPPQRQPERPGGFRMDTPKKPAGEEFGHVDYAERTTLLEAEATSLLPKKAAANDPGAATSVMPQVATKTAAEKNGGSPPPPAKSTPPPQPAAVPGPSPHPRTAPQAAPPPPPPPARPGQKDA